MRRADRLFQIIQILRRAGGPVTAVALAAELEVSKRTVYRDMADLVSQRIPVLGEAGLGYVLEAGFDMPPLMLTPGEIEAAVLGAQLVARLPDADLAASARDLVAKIASVVPKRLSSFVAEPSVGLKALDETPVGGGDMRPLRQAIREGRKIKLRYRGETGGVTERTVWPVILGYAEARCLLIAWCEFRDGFRHFRSDRILHIEVLDDLFPIRRSELRRRWEHWRETERQELTAR